MTIINETEKPRRDPSSVKNWIYRRGDIYLVDFDPVVGSEQGGIRPGLVLQNDIGNFFSPILSVAPVTTQLKRLDLPTHVLLENVPGLKATSMAEIEQPKSVDKQRVRRYLGKISKEQMKAVEAALLIQYGMKYSECIEAP